MAFGEVNAESQFASLPENRLNIVSNCAILKLKYSGEWVTLFMGDNQGGDDKVGASVRSLFADLPSDYEARYAKLKQISHMFHRELGQSLQPTLVEDAQRLASMHLAERRNWVADRNQELRVLHLALKCPKTGRPATLIADSRDGTEKYLRYRLQVFEGGHVTRTFTGQSLPPLEIIEDDSRIESLSRAGSGPRPGNRGR